MVRIKRFLIVLAIAGCGGGGTGTPEDAGAPDDGQPGDGDGGGDVTPAANDRCADATAINLSRSHVELITNTAGSHADLAAPCGSAGVPDVFFKLTLTRRELVYADTFGATGTTALYFASSCSTARTGSTTSGDAVCSTGACGTSQSQVVALLDPGTHYLVLAGQGAATIHLQHAEVGTGTVEHLAPGSSTMTGTTTGTGTLYACDASGAENSYWWQACPDSAGGMFQGSTCNGTAFDTILSLQIPGSETVMCDDDACSFQSSVSGTVPAGAGLFVVSVDGFSQVKQGNYTLAASRP
jgi:hypothetical protein